METLKLNTIDKNEGIKQINKFRLQNKNKWFQVEYKYSPYTYKMKIYNTWIQLLYKYEGDKLINNNPSSMDLNVTEFKDHLQNSIV